MTEAEWEFAARGEEARLYPWGDLLPSCVREGCESVQGMLDGWSENWHSPLGFYGWDVTPLGVHDLVTGTKEFTQDRYDSLFYRSLPEDKTTKNPLAMKGRGHVVRGKIKPSGPVLFRGVSFPLPTFVREGNTIGGIRCGRSDSASAVSEAFLDKRQQLLSGKK